ncbi:phosphotransferase enzyme family protein [Bifidobacterium crudilactis]|jgi:Ser/Thr protein kinase RdoA (MazF antagonist)|uniref:Phosphotransferase n=1 Tax=Bifidobacterium crudilactis TaxID=327277 RepID=A0A971CYZ7_9BIFI|nr:phosphotransferase [Bifidobacterium crudilactis]MCI1868343.1 phosphotransferase [Bifidobacterium crudilactis]MDN5972120.1 phosphotransferase [Bifidobacterium crudilactis]MDN6000003.1 phosphotransferase [Bifidobacterium crudilactis]MDN6210248.1 phosphotransferase [Bifidobacterium crudilactis]MDN6234047.1 phosphotransferase [Bifidobacterium crudilactis]
MSEVLRVLDEPEQSVSLNAFSNLSKGDPAPFWLFRGVCACWGLDSATTTLDLITVSENATFVLRIDGKDEGVVRVSQPGYVGGPEAVASEILWLNSLHDVEGVNLINPVPTIRGTFVGTVRDGNGVGWTVISTKFVTGTVLEDMENPAPYYTTIGAWAAKFHQHSRSWDAPRGFKRFNWDISDMVGPSPRWGRWENASLSDEERAVCEQALWKAMDVVMKTPRTQQTWGLIHADLRPSNIIRDADGKLTIIDFDDAGYSWYLYDYASSLSFIEHMPYAPELARSWVKGYEQVAGAFSEDQFEVMSALSMIRRLQMLGWTTNHREDALPEELATTQASGSVLCAQRYLADSRWLLG